MRNKLDLNALHLFVAVADKGTFSAAAKALDMPSSNVSRAISRLEEQMNVRLIERSTRRMQLTEAGQLLYSRAQPLLASLEETQAELAVEQLQLKGRLRVCLPNEVGPSLLAGLFADFALLHPQLEMHCVTNLSGLESLQQDLDLAMIITRGKLEDSDCVVRPLASFPCVVVAAPALIETCGKPQNSRQLADFPCITTVDALKGQPWQFVAPGGGFETVAISGHYRVNSGEMALRAAVAGVGFAVLARQGCAAWLESGELEEVRLELQPAPLELIAAYSSRRFLSAKARALVDYLQQHLK